MTPIKEKHETSFVYEPTSGVAMKLTARFQINIKALWKFTKNLTFYVRSNAQCLKPEKSKTFVQCYSLRIFLPFRFHNVEVSRFLYHCTHILHEINFEDYWSAKSAILTHLETLNFDFIEFLFFLRL